MRLAPFVRMLPAVGGLCFGCSDAAPGAGPKMPLTPDGAICVSCQPGGADAGGAAGQADDAATGRDAAASADAGAPHASDSACADCSQCEEQLPVTGANHVAGDVMYSETPPVSGDHSSCWADWGVHAEEVPEENWVHNLEHGGVVFLYRCPTGCTDAIERLTALVNGRKQVMLSPYAKLRAGFAAVSWGYRLVTTCFDEPAFRSFYERHVDHAPESVTGVPPSYCHSK